MCYGQCVFVCESKIECVCVCLRVKERVCVRVCLKDAEKVFFSIECHTTSVAWKAIPKWCSREEKKRKSLLSDIMLKYSPENNKKYKLLIFSSLSTMIQKCSCICVSIRSFQESERSTHKRNLAIMLLFSLT